MNLFSELLLILIQIHSFHFEHLSLLNWILCLRNINRCLHSLRYALLLQCFLVDIDYLIHVIEVRTKHNRRILYCSKIIPMSYWLFRVLGFDKARETIVSITTKEGWVIFLIIEDLLLLLSRLIFQLRSELKKIRVSLAWHLVHALRVFLIVIQIRSECTLGEGSVLVAITFPLVV